MKKLALFLCVLLNADLAFSCEHPLVLKVEQETIRMCNVNGRIVSEKCAENSSKCSLISDLDHLYKEMIKEVIEYSKNRTSNVGATACAKIGWTEHKAKMNGGHQVCVCSNQKSEWILCSSLLN